MAIPMNEKYPTDEEETRFERAANRQALPSWGWREFRDSQALMKLIALDLMKEQEGGTRTVLRLARWGQPALNLVEQVMEKAYLIEKSEISPEKLARDHMDHGSISSAMACVLAGNEVWLRWVLKNGADPLWMDFGRRTLASHLFNPRYMNSIFDMEDIGEKDLTQSRVLRWARGQNRIIEMLRKHNRGQTWTKLMEGKDMNNKSVQEYIKENVEKAEKAYFTKILDEAGKAEYRKTILRGVAMCISDQKKPRPSKPSI